MPDNTDTDWNLIPGSLAEIEQARERMRQEPTRREQPTNLIEALIVAAGPVTNFLVAIAILASFNYAYGKLQIAPVVAVMEAGGAADKAGLRPGDRILEVNGSTIASFDQIRALHGLGPDEVKALMRQNLKSGSYRAWRRRVRAFSDRREVYK